MPTPTQRHTKSRKRIRRAAIKLGQIGLSSCSQCKKPVKPHTACSFCGTYKGRQVLKIRIKKGERKKKKKETI